MTEIAEMIDDNDVDAPADEEIYQSLSLENPKSFFLFAGAGSGKTRSLVTCVDRFIRVKANERSLQISGRKIGIITYTNAACDEIVSRLKFSPLVEVSTIHSFVWSLIRGFDADIRTWLTKNLEIEISELEAQQLKGRASKASSDRERSIQSKRKRLDSLPSILKFTYNPNGDNLERDSLNHSEVIKIGSYFVEFKALMQRLLIAKFPVLLVDESQDTNKLLMNALFEVQKANSKTFSLGLLGDTMQRIYSDGKIDLGQNLPPDWSKPSKIMNHRCPKRVVDLINKIRADTDGISQRYRSDSKAGYVRFFVAESGAKAKVENENFARKQMAEITSDQKWFGPNSEVKALILEHHMAAARMGFAEMFEPLYRIKRFQTGLLNGNLPLIRFFSTMALPVFRAHQKNDEFALAAVVRKFSPLLSKDALKNAGKDQSTQLAKARDAVNSMMSLWTTNEEPSFLDVLKNISASGLFEVPDNLTVENDTEEPIGAIQQAIDDFMRGSFRQIDAYERYISGKGEFDTHQGVKGLEFPRVMVVIDDDEARGFLFSYDKLFGAKPKSATDLKNETEGSETGIDRTRRLFYVTCSRAEESLAIVAHSENPKVVRDFVISSGWFTADEVVLI